MIDVTHTASLLEIIYTLLSITGIVLMGYTLYDNYHDLSVLLRRHIDSYSRLTASIGIWDAFAAMLFHCLFLVLGIFALVTPPPAPERRAFSDLFAAGFILMQMVIVGVQLRNQLARMRMRRRVRDTDKHLEKKNIP